VAARLAARVVRRVADRGLDVLPAPALAAMARAAFAPRPIGPYPGWFYGAFRENRSSGAGRRLAIWRAANRRGADRPVVLDWHGIRLRAFLGNAMTLPLFVDGAIEPNELALVDSVLRPGHVFVDAGANEGLFTLVASRRVGPAGRVLAIEPSGREAERLRANLDLNDGRNVVIREVALGDRPGTAVLHVADQVHSGQNTLGGFIHDVVRHSHDEEVEVATLDDVVTAAGLSRLDVIKVDVEGADTAALRGGAGTLRRFRPLVLVELADAALRAQGSSAEELVALLSGHGYDLYAFDETTGRPRPFRPGEPTLTLVAAHGRPPWEGSG
jgi:FkbM family methyltransferase